MHMTATFKPINQMREVLGEVLETVDTVYGRFRTRYSPRDNMYVCAFIETSAPITSVYVAVSHKYGN